VPEFQQSKDHDNISYSAGALVSVTYLQLFELSLYVARNSIYDNAKPHIGMIC
jgi:hypothetical protein